MGVKTKRQTVAQVAYQGNATVQQEIYVPQRFVWNVYLRLCAVLDVSVEATAAITRNPGTLVDLRLMLNNSRILAAGHWYSFAHERSLLNFVLPTETVAANTVAAYPINSFVRIPQMNPWSRYPWETCLDMREEQRLDLFISWGDITDMVTGGTAAWTAEPTIDIVVETSETAPRGASAGYYVQRELETTGLGTVANADLQIELPVGPDHNYIAMVHGSMDTVANSGRALVATAWNDVELEFRGPAGHQMPVQGMSGLDIQGTFKQGCRHPDPETVGIYPHPLLGGPGGGMISQAVQTGDASDLRWHIDHAGYTTAGVILTCYDIYQPRLR